MKKPTLVYIWHVSFPNYTARMFAMSRAVQLAKTLAESLTLVPKE